MDDSRFPPYVYVYQVLEHCPKAGLTYLNLWTEKDAQNCVKIYRDDIQQTFFTSRTKFKNDLFSLSKEGLLSVSESDLTMKIQLLDLANLISEHA